MKQDRTPNQVSRNESDLPTREKVNEALEKAKAYAAPETPVKKADLIPILVILREKKVSWWGIRSWMEDELGMRRSTTYWQQLYTKRQHPHSSTDRNEPA